MNCLFCSETLESGLNLFEHVLDIHSNELITKRKSLRRQNEASSPSDCSVSNEPQVQCKFCKEKLQTVDHFIFHANACHLNSIVDGWVACSSCNILLPGPESLNNHTLIFHVVMSKMFKCQLCATTFSESVAYLNHDCKTQDSTPEIHLKPVTIKLERIQPEVLTTTPELPDMNRKKGDNCCDFCEQSFKFSAFLYNHVNKEHKTEASETWVSCPSCSFLYPDEDVLRNHETVAHNLTSMKVDIPPRPRPRPRPKKKASAKPRVRKNKLRSHRLNLSDTTTRTQCHFCDKTFIKESLEMCAHANTEHSMDVANCWVICHKCGEFFPTNRFLSIHNEICHDKRKKNDENHLTTCTYCPRKYAPSSRKSHMRYYHPDILLNTWINCKVCSSPFPSELALKKHMTKHPKAAYDSTEKCPLCDKETKLQYLIIHVNRQHADQASQVWLTCDVCSRCFPNEKLLNSHKLQLHKNNAPEKVFSCEVCKLNFRAMKSLLNHVNTIHIKELEAGTLNWKKCQFCPLYLSSKGHLSNHVNHTHLKEKTAEYCFRNDNSCKFCDRRFTTSMKLYLHATKDHLELVKDEWFFCDQCNIYFPTKISLTIHNNHGKHFKNLNDIEKITCNFCQKTFCSRVKMTSHANKVHIDQLRLNWLPCSTCGDFFEDEKRLDRHILVRHRTMKPLQTNSDQSGAKLTKCHFCSKLLAFEGEDYYRHASSAHQAEVELSWFPCEHCSLYLPNKSSLKRHLVSHTPQKNSQERKPNLIEATSTAVRCQFCALSFSSLQDCIEHTNQTHPREIRKDWLKCSRCEYFAPSDNLLRDHGIMEHSGPPAKKAVMRIACTECDSLFDKASDFYWHANSCHKDAIAADWYCCNNCDFYFPEWENLEQHRIYFHQEI